MEITLDQQKLISSPLRAKIIYLLNERAMTAKQVADELRKSNGSIHYHIQQLYNGGIIELVKTKDNKGSLKSTIDLKPLSSNSKMNSLLKKEIIL